ncbi:DUF4215 domain-containing protein, partial [Patescibacteria group bacterium]|nr:DUF4215 domain-containing protein [Patescibacteria group bacterium]
IQAIYDAGTGGMCASICGDGLVEDAEACDDGDTDPDDGCSSTCTVEAGYSCVGEPSVCTLTGGCGTLGPNELCASLTITGSKDIWYNNYDTGSIQDITFSPLSASMNAQTTPGSNVTDNTLDVNDLIGVINMDSAAWTLSVSLTDFDNGAGSTIPKTNLYLATSGYDATHFSGTGSLSAVHMGNPVTLTNNATDNIYYYITPNSGYSYTANDLTAPYNTSTALNSASSYTQQANNTTILSTAQTDTAGIFTVGIGYLLNIPGNTPGGTYITTITYTLN